MYLPKEIGEVVRLHDTSSQKRFGKVTAIMPELKHCVVVEPDDLPAWVSHRDRYFSPDQVAKKDFDGPFSAYA